GSYHIHAVYLPQITNPSFNTSADATDGTLTIAKDSTKTAVTSTGLSNAFSTASQMVQFTATVNPGNTAAGSTVNEGTVTSPVVNRGGTTVARWSGKAVSSGSAGTTFDLAGLPAGNYHVRAAYVPKAPGPNFTASSDATGGTLAITKDTTTTKVTSTSLSETF